MDKTTLLERLDGAEFTDLYGRTIAAGVWESEDGNVPVIGYQTDYKYEEEAGVSELSTALRGDDPRNVDPLDAARRHVAVFSDVNGFVISTSPLERDSYTWGERIGFEDRYVGDFSSMLCGVQGVPRYHWETVAKLREEAARIGAPKPWPRKKADLVAHLVAHATPERPDLWPAWFQSGRLFVVRADRGITADAVEYLADAASRNRLSVAPTSGPFRTGLVLCNADDVGPRTRADLVEMWDTHDAHMALVEPVVEELKAKGHKFYFVGRPTELSVRGEPVKLRFWVNGWQNPGADKQIFGWFTVDELADESFVQIANAERAARDTVSV